MGAIDQQFLTQILAGVGLLVLCVIGYRTIVWFRQDVRGPIQREEDALIPFREAFEAGEIDRDELERVRVALERQRAREHEALQASPEVPGSDDKSATSETSPVDPF